MSEIYTKIFIGLVGVFAGSAVTFFITRYKLRKDRQYALTKQWVDEFKDALADLCKNSSFFHHGENVVPFGREKHSEYLMLANTYRYRLQVLLDPKVPREKSILDAIEKVMFAMFEGNAKPGEGGSLLHNSIERLIDLSRALITVRESQM